MGLIIELFRGSVDLSTVILVIVCGLGGMVLMERKGHGGIGFLLGFLLGPLGIVVVWLLPRKEKGPEADPSPEVDREQTPQ